MAAHSIFSSTRRAARLLVACAGLASSAGSAAEPTAPAPATWKITTSLGIRETYDSNVYLQDHAPSPTVVGAVPAGLSSLVTSVFAGMNVESRGATGLVLTGSYAPEVVRYHSAAAENYTTHRAQIGASRRSGATAWNFSDALVWIDGSKDSPIYGGPGGAPALGGIPMRDRRAALVNRSAFRLETLEGRWLLRALASGYWHDFRTNQFRQAGCANYVDRSEVCAGIEAGYEFRPKTRVIAGLRLARQNQGSLFGVDSPYDSTRRRFVGGLEGAPASWLQLTLLAALETRTFAPGTPAGFDRHKRLLWIDASATATATPRDTITLTLRRAEQPASTSISIYEDTAGELTWRHKCTARLTAGAALKIWTGIWQLPAVRRDRVCTPTLLLQFAATQHCLVEATWSYDDATSGIPSTDGREFTRHLCNLSVRHTF